MNKKMNKLTSKLRTPFKKSLFDCSVGIAFIAGVSINFASWNGTDLVKSESQSDTVVKLGYYVNSKVDATEKTDLIFMREEEKLASDANTKLEMMYPDSGVLQD